MMSTEAESLRTLLARSDLPLGLAWAMSEPMDDPNQLFPEEQQAIAHAIPIRRAEFTGGRIAARKAMWALGFHPAAIPMTEDRAPAWPDGLIGSITHADDICMAVVAQSDRYDGLGLDLEPDVAMDPDLVADLCRDEDLANVPVAEQVKLPKRIFSAKEAAFKAHYARHRTLFDFEALTVDLATGRVQFTQDQEVLDLPQTALGGLTVQQWICDGMILSLCALPAH
ncbi:4'-phosphopantetheinyl transferase superfamily protein [Tropicibacter sp. R15_0]|uniref:4'-phosphopantetheinyl transferase family protein n=1 Tax=Tropicibacter sp. R15_0 TaxID=2821101 RepID=UPI001ADB3840|nr:4'-phosphopantetheinyl transferase superfamily protein [Tropicibacter sp. R15_0]MBO9464099.1 4'-phosphopantetheinyl transferase superfamily protein [Tropicibacter sp. R15_0]